MDKKIIEQLNEFGKNRTPFLFIIDFEQNNPLIYPLDKIDKTQLLYSINNYSNYNPKEYLNKVVSFSKKPISYNNYKLQFDKVYSHLQKGNSYLTNLTCETPVFCNLSLVEIFKNANALYKIWFNNKWTVFSPETFIKIIDGKIFSFPMKGTIDASLPDAKKEILENKKEMAEHATIVDLIRNDLSLVATKIAVDKYRYIDEIKTNQKNLLQVSSQISGYLPNDYAKNIGGILSKLLPAGSISGAPKEKTVNIIEETETHNRNYYTGICGIFDGKNIDSGVMIRYMENRNNQLFFKSGGGITVNSNCKEEYNEMINKVYLPFS